MHDGRCLCNIINKQTMLNCQSAWLRELSMAERCLIHAENVSLLQRLQPNQPMLKMSHQDHFI